MGAAMQGEFDIFSLIKRKWAIQFFRLRLISLFFMYAYYNR